MHFVLRLLHYEKKKQEHMHKYVSLYVPLILGQDVPFTLILGQDVPFTLILGQDVPFTLILGRMYPSH